MCLFQTCTSSRLGLMPLQFFHCASFYYRPVFLHFHFLIIYRGISGRKICVRRCFFFASHSWKRTTKTYSAIMWKVRKHLCYFLQGCVQIIFFLQGQVQNLLWQNFHCLQYGFFYFILFFTFKFSNWFYVFKISSCCLGLILLSLLKDRNFRGVASELQWGSWEEN